MPGCLLVSATTAPLSLTSRKCTTGEVPKEEGQTLVASREARPSCKALGTRGRGSALPPCARPPGPPALRRYRSRTRTGSMVDRVPGTLLLPSVMLGHDQPRDSHVHG